MMMNKPLWFLILGLGLQAGPPNLAHCAPAPVQAPATPAAAETSQARKLLDRARIYTELESYDPAEADILEVLKLELGNSPIHREAAQVWHQISDAKKKKTEAVQQREKRKLKAHLDEAGRLASEGKISEAASKASEVLAATDEPELLAQANRILARRYPTFGGLLRVAWRDASTAFGWLLNLVAGLVLVALLYGALCLARKVAFRDKRWRVGVIDDKSGVGVADFVVTSFNRWKEHTSSTTAGLVYLETLELPSVPALEQAGPELDLSAALESLSLQIGTVSIQGIAKAVNVLRGWFHALQPTITGAAFIKEPQIIVHLLKHSATGGTRMVTAASDATRPESAAESASFKMYYLIGKKGSTVSDADLANKLREGLDQLSQYVSGRDPNQLQKAYETFRDVVREKPTFDEACLYEGIALDLLEKHDEARSRFEYLASNAEDVSLRQKASYNAAVSQFRRYTPKGLEQAITELKKLIGSDPTETILADSPLKALARAAVANAIAHKSIFWQVFLHDGDPSKDETEIRRRKKVSRLAIEKWLEEVRTTIVLLDGVYESSKQSKKWDALARRQLQWAIWNAKGNAYLNAAIGFFSPPTAEPDAPKVREDFLAQALMAFQQCEVILPPGVETLANLATTLNALCRRREARHYANEAIKLNPTYEYAYYRLAESWADEKRNDEIVKVLAQFPGVPRIAAFREFYDRFSVEPQRQPV